MDVVVRGGTFCPSLPLRVDSKLDLAPAYLRNASSALARLRRHGGTTTATVGGQPVSGLYERYPRGASAVR